MMKTESRKNEISPKNILYELMLYTEWTQESDVTRSLCKANEKNAPLFYRIFKPWNYFKKCDSLLDEVTNLQNGQLNWHFAIGEVGSVLAVLQDSVLEVRTPRDDFCSIVGKTTVPREGSMQWRRLCWSPDCAVLAVASSTGAINFYDLFGSNIFNIPSPKNIKDGQIWLPEYSLAGMFFIPARVKKEKWPYELIVVDYGGELRSYFVSPADGFAEFHNFSFSKGGVSSVCWDGVHNLLYACTPPDHANLDLKNEPIGWGLSAWRLLNEHPYYRLAIPSPEDLGRIEARRGFTSWISSFYKYHPFSVVFKMVVCPDAQLLACLHTCGTVSVWHLPSLRLHGVWELKEQPGYDVEPEEKKRNTQAENFLPIDISWWPQQKVIIARRNGAVSVCELVELRNMLGETPEFVFGEARLSPATMQKGILLLECETGNQEGTGDDEELSLVTRSSVVIQAILYWLTDIEKFQPRRRKAKLQTRIYRLRGIKSTTPEELFSRKIDARQFDEALYLAEVYGLDCDRVYQSQWRNSPVSEETISAYLSKISKKQWVFEECYERVPDTLDAAKKLIEFGLRITSISALAELSGNIGTGDESQLIHEGQEIVRGVVELLSEDQKCLICARRTLLKFSDRLFTYEKIINSSEFAYDRESYDKFRRQPVAQSALEYARRSDHRAISLLFTYQGGGTLPYWLSILSNFPETTNPATYKDLLPECTADGDVFLWEQSEIRGKDWSESSHFMVLEPEEDVSEFQLPPKDELLCAAVVQEWYRNRVYELELMSNMVDQPLELVKLARERNIKGLDGLFNELVTLDVLVYDVGMEDISLRDLEVMTPLQKAQALMSKSNEQSFVENLKYRLLPYLQRCEKLQSVSHQLLLSQFLAQISSDDLSCPLKMFEYCISEPTSGLVSGTEELICLALDCVYAYKGTDHLHKAHTLLNILPVSSLGSEEAGLRERVKAAEDELKVALILRTRGRPLSISAIHQQKNDAEMARTLFQDLSTNVGSKIPAAGETDWNDLLQDLLQMQILVFRCVAPQLCYEVHAAGVLASSDLSVIRTAVRSLCCHSEENHDKPLTLERSIALVLQAAINHFDSAASLTDHEIILAKGCLNIISEDNADIQEEKDLIAGLQLLNEFKINILPVQMRLCKDRMRLIESCLSSRPTAYKDYHKLLSLAHKLRICGNDSRQREGIILLRVANIAFEGADYNHCAEICRLLMDRKHALGWEPAMRMGQCAQYTDIPTRQQLIAFALIHCPDDRIQELLETRCELEHKKLQMFINEQASIVETPSDDEEFLDAPTTPQSPAKEFLPLGLSSTIQNTSKLLTQLTDSGFWRGKLLNRGDATINADKNSSVGPKMTQQAFPELYGNIHKNCTLSKMYHWPDESNGESQQLRLMKALLRANLLEQEKLPKQLLRHVDNVLVQLAAMLMPEDSAVGLATLLAVSKPEAIDQCFLRLPLTLLTLQLAVYMFALRETLPHNPDVFYWTPDQVLAWATAHTDSLSETSQLLTRALAQLSNFEQSKQVEQLNCGVDVRRFAWDPQYKTDSILGLAMCEEWDKLQAAIDLASSHGVETWEVVFSHIRALLSSDSDLLTQRLADNRLTTLLSDHAETVVHRFEESVLPTLRGTNYNQLISYYTVLQTVAPNTGVHGMLPRDHIKLIKKVKASSPDIDYVRLVTSPQDVLEVLRPAVKKDTVNIIAKLLKEILKALPSLQSHISVSRLYLEWAITQFKAECLSPTCHSPLDQMLSLQPYLLKLNGAELLSFVHRAIFCHQSVLKLDPYTRQDMIDYVLRSGHHTHPLNDDPDFKKIQELKDYIKRVWGLENPSFKTLKNYLVRLDEACGDAEAIATVIQTACVDASLPSQLLQKMAQLSSRRTLSSHVTTLLHSLPAHPAMIATVLQRVEDCLSAGEQGDSWSILIGPLTERPELPASVRKQAALITQRLGAQYSEELEALRLRTEAVLRRPIALSQVSDQNCRYLLFKQMLSQANSWDDLQLLHLLLTSWPHVDTSWYLELIEAMAEVPNPEMFSTMQKIFQKNQFEEGEVAHLISRLEGGDEVFIVTVSLLTNFKSLHEKAAELLRKLSSETHLRTGLVKRIVETGLIAQFVEAPVFPRLRETLLECEEELQELAASHLRESGHGTEADDLSYGSL